MMRACPAGGVRFGLVCDVGVVIAARGPRGRALKMCRAAAHAGPAVPEMGVMLWGVAARVGTPCDRVGAGGCQGARDWQKVNATTILVLGALAMAAILFGGGEDALHATENFVAAGIRAGHEEAHAHEAKRRRARG